MIEIVQAKFIGLDGSAGYRHGQTYSLMVETNMGGPEIRICLSDDRATGRVPYENALALLRNWANFVFDPSSPTGVAAADLSMPGDNREFEAATYIDSKGTSHIVTEITDPHLINIARKKWRTGQPNPVIDAELKRRNIEIKEHLTKEDLE